MGSSRLDHELWFKTEVVENWFRICILGVQKFRVVGLIKNIKVVVVISYSSAGGTLRMLPIG